jgi:hypothetical protein
MDAPRGAKNLRLRLRLGLFSASCSSYNFVMKAGIEEQSVEEEWQAAQAALSDAQKLPSGPQHFEALKKGWPTSIRGRQAKALN